METYSANQQSDLVFPKAPEYEGTVVPLYWEPVMGSGEKIAAIIAAIGRNQEVEVTPVIKPAVLGVMFPGQKRNAQNMLTWVSSSIKRHLSSGKSIESWECPITGFSVGPGASSLGESLADMINQAKLLYCSLSTATGSEREKSLSSRTGYDTETVRGTVIASVRQALGIDAEQFIVPDGIKLVLEDNHKHFLELSFEDKDRVASIVSAHYSTTETVERHILTSQSDLLVASQRTKKPVMYIALPEDDEFPDKAARVKVGNAVDELNWRLKKIGVEPQIHASAEDIAESVCEYWA